MLKVLEHFCCEEKRRVPGLLSLEKRRLLRGISSALDVPAEAEVRANGLQRSLPTSALL